jgi:hypothetical protein
MDYEIIEHHDHSHVGTDIFDDISYDVEIFGIPEHMYPSLFEKIENLWKEDCKKRGDDAFNLYTSKIEDRSFWFPEQPAIYHEIKMTCLDETMLKFAREIIKPFFIQHMKETEAEMDEMQAH